MAITIRKKKAKTVQYDKSQAEHIVNDAPRTFTEADFPVGTSAHQGDLILVRIETLPASAKPRTDRQLAIGSTQGSRHVLERGRPYDCKASEVVAAIQCVCPKAVVSEEYAGPAFQCSRGRADLVHPEHGNHTYVGEMTIAVVYQRNLDAEERERRTLD